MQITPYLNFNNQCEAAFKFYEKCFRGKILMIMKQGDTPMAAQLPAEHREKVMHARLIADNMLLMGSDCPEGQAEKPQGFAVALGFTDPAEAERVYNELSVNGSVKMALQETFWARKFAMFTDQFGTPWMINCEKPM